MPAYKTLPPLKTSVAVIQAELELEPKEAETQKFDRKKPHSIQVSHQTYRKLRKLKEKGRKTSGTVPTFNQVVSSLVANDVAYHQLEAEYDQLEATRVSQLQQENAYLRQILVQSLDQAKAITNFNLSNLVAPQFQQNSLNALAPPPRPPSAASPGVPPRMQSPPVPKISNYTPPDTGDLRRDYQSEITQIFSGKILKPSEVLETTQPKHVNGMVNEIDEDFIVPKIDTISTAKGFSQADAVPLNA